MISESKTKKRIEALYGKKNPKMVECFIPKGRKGLYIYAVAVRHHPDKVKIGMTQNWQSRRNSYANWNLSPGDGIAEERVFCLTDEFVDLAKLERHILNSIPLVRAHGAEWFFGSVDDAARYIDEVLCCNEISYVL